MEPLSHTSKIVVCPFSSLRRGAFLVNGAPPAVTGFFHFFLQKFSRVKSQLRDVKVPRAVTRRAPCLCAKGVFNALDSAMSLAWAFHMTGRATILEELTECVF